MTTDQLSDTGLVLWNRISQLYPSAALVKSAEVCEAPEQFVSGAFAHQAKPYRFPIHNKEATLVSWLYFLHDNSLSRLQKQAAEDRLQRAAKLYEIEKEVAAILAKHAELQTEVPLNDDDYGLITEIEGKKARLYPLRHTKEVRAAANYVLKHLPALREQYTYGERQQFAESILDKAAQFGASITDEQQELLERMAGRGFTSPAKIAESITARVRGGEKVPAELRVMMNKLAEGYRKNSSLCVDGNTMSALARTLEDFDRAHKLFNKYSEVIPSPEETAFSITVTKAAQARDESCMTQTGSIYGHEQFGVLSLNDVSSVFGDDVAEQSRTGLRLDPVKFAKIAAALSRTQAMYLDDLLEEKGVQPMLKDSTVQAFSMSIRELQEIAAGAAAADIH